MSRMFVATFVLSLALVSPALAQNSPKANDSQALRITHGPTVEFVGTTRAVIAWSTNVSGGTTVHYGIDPNNLSEKAQMPWGALTHRVTLTKLQPDTRYYFQIDSEAGAGTGSNAQGPVKQFHTKPIEQAVPPS